MSKVIKALRHEHTSIENVLGALERQIAVIAQGEPADYALIASIVDYFTDFPDRQHHPKEDLVFARLRRADPAAAQSVGDLIESHTILAEEFRAFAAALNAVMHDEILSRTQFVEQARAFIEHQRLHLAMEETSFFPVAERTLDRDAWAELEKEMTATPDPLIGGKAGDKFEALRRNIMSWEAALVTAR